MISDRQKGGVSREGGLPAQIAALTNSIIGFARNIDNLDLVVRSIQGVCHKHISRGVSVEQYDAIAECFLSAMLHVLGEEASENIMSSWTEAFALLASLYIQNEARIRKELEAKAGYSGFVNMCVLATEEDDDGNKKISLKPESLPVPSHKPGQFVSIAITTNNGEETMTSMKIADDENDRLWISVPKSMEKASLYLLTNVNVGSILKVSIPCGKSR